MEKIEYCYHTHTKRCGHASGEDEEYVINAINGGIKRLGFSDHIFLPGVVQKNIRGNFKLLDNYLTSINNLKEKYKDKINIKLGFEAEYMEHYIPYYKELLNSKKIEYLILGQHCFYEENNPLMNGLYPPGDTHNIVWYKPLGFEAGLKKYTKDLISGMATGLFKYVAHPDAFGLYYKKWDKLTEECSKKIIDAAIKYNMPLEINLQQARKYGIEELDGTTSFVYPLIPFWKMVAKTNIKVVVGFDSHQPGQLFDPGYKIIEYLINITGLKIDFDYSI